MIATQTIHASNEFSSHIIWQGSGSLPNAVTTIRKEEWEAFPIPAEDILYLSNTGEHRNYELFDAQGALVLSGLLDNTSLSSIQINMLTAGLYTIKIGAHTKSFLKN